MTAVAATCDEASQEDDESALVRRAASGDRAAFEQIYRRHRDRIYALCWRLSGAQEQVALDLLQQAFLRAWRKLATFRGDAAFTTWMHRLTVNVALSDRRIRLRQTGPEVSLEEQPRGEVSAGHTANVALRVDLERAIAGLPERARTVLVLHDVEGLRHKDIAELTGIAVGTSKAHLHRARQMVKEQLQT